MQPWQQRTPAMAAGLTARVWSLSAVLRCRVPPWPHIHVGYACGPVEPEEQPLGGLRRPPLFRVECGGDLPRGDQLIRCSSSCQTHVEKAQVMSRTVPLHDRRTGVIGDNEIIR